MFYLEKNKITEKLFFKNKFIVWFILYISIPYIEHDRKNKIEHLVRDEWGADKFETNIMIRYS